MLALPRDFAGRQAIYRAAEASQTHSQRRADASLEEQAAIDPVLRGPTEVVRRLAHDNPRNACCFQ
jgi:hypothetical protein